MKHIANTIVKVPTNQGYQQREEPIHSTRQLSVREIKQSFKDNPRTKRWEVIEVRML